MIVYDITREMFSAESYPGDPLPRVTALKTIRGGDGYHLSRISVGSHIGTHIDAPMHFVEGGRDAASIVLAGSLAASALRLATSACQNAMGSGHSSLTSSST